MADLGRDLSMVFGRSVRPDSPEFLRLDPATIRKAFRTRALACHPDTAGNLGLSPEQLNQRFVELNDAHHRLQSALSTGAVNRLLMRRCARPSQKPACTVPSAATAQARQADFHYRGPMPARQLRLGQFLYYSGLVSWRTLIDALVWQHRRRPLIGQTAQRLGYLDQAEILRIQRCRRPDEQFGAAAVRLGHLSQHQLNVALGHQRLVGCPLGRYFTDHRILTPDQLSGALVDLHCHNLRHR